MSPRSPEDLEPGLDLSDDVDRLLSLAGRRRRLSEDEVTPAREAARAAWRRGRARSTRRRVIWTAAMAASLGLVMIAVVHSRRANPGSPRDSEPVAALLVRSGGVFVTGTSPDSSSLGSNSTIETGLHGRAALGLAGGGSLRIDVSSRVRLESPARLTLDRGAIYLDSPPGSHRTPIAIETPLGIVRHLGTQFEVRLTAGSDAGNAIDTLRVSVREGSVSIEREGIVSEADAGTELILGGDGSIQRNAASAEGPTWLWTQEVAPEYRIEGQILSSYVAWVSREIGLPIRFASLDLEATTGSTVLHGDIAGLSPEESLDIVLPSCGLTFARSTDSIRIESAEPQ